MLKRPLLAVCLLSAWTVCAQETPQPETPPAPPPSQRPALQAPAAPQSTTKAPASTLPPPDTKADIPKWDGAPSIEVVYWQPTLHPKLITGKGVTAFGNVDLKGKSQYAGLAVVTIPITAEDLLRFSFFRLQGRSGTSIAPKDTTIFGTTYAAGNAISNKYRIQSAKLSFESLMYPYPQKGHSLRFKTLWEVQYVSLDAKLNASTTDTSGTVTTNPSTGNRYVIYPTLGLGMAYAPNHVMHFEMKGSGFGLPHRAYIADVETSLAFQVRSFALVLGGKYYDFRTSPQKDEYTRARIAGAFAGIRYYLR